MRAPRSLVALFALVLLLVSFLVLESAPPLSTLAAPADGEGWIQLHTANAPSPRYTHGMVYDSQRQVALLFGGHALDAFRAGDTWEFNGTDWTRLTPPQSPPGRANIDQVLTYDPHRNRTVLFGGLGDSGHLGDTWEFDGSNWTQIATPNAPAPRDSHAMVYDSLRRRVLLFGGYDANARVNDTWVYDGTWQQVPTSVAPPPRSHYALAYDAARDVVIAFGGLRDHSNVLGDTWEFNGTEWQQVQSDAAPPARFNHTLVYDPVREVTILYGGEGPGGYGFTDTWEYDANGWRQVYAPAPAYRKEMPLAYFPALETVFFFGGGNWDNGGLTTFNETFAYEPSGAPLPPTPTPTSTPTGGWLQIETAHAPTARYTHGMVYDSARNVALLFGGDATDDSRASDTWEFDGTDWTRLTPPQSPPGRANIDEVLTYDAHRNRTVLFGGLGYGGYLGDTWEFDGSTWTEVNPPTAPEPRDSHAMVYDSGQQRVFLFGGHSAAAIRLSDTWVYDGTWQQLDTPLAPLRRSHHAMAYDEARGVVVLFGGLLDHSTTLGDTWEFDGTEWQQVQGSAAPVARFNHSMEYDPVRQVIVMHGGESGSANLTDTWEYDANGWRQVYAAAPSFRKEMQLAYFPALEKILYFGGGIWYGGALSTFNGTYTYGASDAPPPTPTPTPTPPPLPAPDFTRSVYLVIYDPTLSTGEPLSSYMGLNDPQSTAQSVIAIFNDASADRVQFTIGATTIITDHWPLLVDGYQYTEADYLAVINGDASPHAAMADYNSLVNSQRLDICGKVNRNEIDEVWLLGGPHFGFYQSTLVGPGAYPSPAPPVPEPFDCTRLTPIMGVDLSQHAASAIQAFGHRMEAAMTRAYGGWQQNQTSHNWERHALVKVLSPDYFYSGCGNIFYPPNAPGDHVYDSTASVLSNCEDFENYPDLGDPTETARPVDCSAWGCNAIGFYEYWYRHLPDKPGCLNGVYNDWWIYFVSPAHATRQATGCQWSHVQYLPQLGDNARFALRP